MLKKSLTTATSSLAIPFLALGTLAPPSHASGGATAGKYTTIPIAKRRYYGRVQEAIRQYLILGPAIVKGDVSSGVVQQFFDKAGIVTVEGVPGAILANGKCATKKADGSCKGAEIRDSRYNDMKTTMYLLANAFRFNQQKAPENLPTVRAAKKFFVELDTMEKACRKSPEKNVKKIQAAYLNGLEILDEYLDLVELPPLDSGNYSGEAFDTKVGRSARIT